MRSGHKSQLADVTVEVSEHPCASMYRCAHLSTLRRFDNKVQGTVKTGQLIPCERRLRKMEILEFQEVTFEARFGNRDYGRPFKDILVTLGRFD